MPQQHSKLKCKLHQSFPIFQEHSIQFSYPHIIINIVKHISERTTSTQTLLSLITNKQNKLLVFTRGWRLHHEILYTYIAQDKIICVYSVYLSTNKKN